MFEEWKHTLTKEQIIDYLLEWQHKGFHIVEKRPPIIDGWTIIYSPTIWVAIRPGDRGTDLWDVCVGNLGRTVGSVGTLQDLKSYVESAWRSFGISIEARPTQLSTYKNKPISNISSLIAMISTSLIEAIQDAYVDNLTLQNFNSMYTLGVKFSPKVRLLTSRTKIDNKQLTKSFIEDFCKETGIYLEVRSLNKNHQRLIFLSDKRCISPDFSLNNYMNDGSINEIRDYMKLHQTFEDNWAKASVFYEK